MSVDQNKEVEVLNNEQAEELFLDAYVTKENEPLVSYRDKEKKLYFELVRSWKFKSHVREWVFLNESKILTEKQLQARLDHIAAACYLGDKRVTLHTRVCWDKSAILVDGIDSIYRIDESGYQKVLMDRPIFRKWPTLLPLAEPQMGGDLKELLNFVNIKDKDAQLVFLVYLVGALIPSIPHPVLIMYGPQGAAKSTSLRLVTELLDPSQISEVPFRNEKDFVLTAVQKWVVGLDNVSFLKNDVSDLFCKLVTGASYSARALYTDDDLIIRHFQRVVIINGINLPVEKPDLMDRCILIPLERIDPTSRKTEKEITFDFESIKGKLLGACFSALSKALKIYPTVRVSEKSRMADFHVWGCAIAQALGFAQEDFIRAWNRNIELQQEESLEASSIAALIHQWFRENGRFDVLEGTPNQCLKQLKAVAQSAGIDERSLPRNATAFSKKLQEVRPNLEAHGYVVLRTRGKERRITIKRPPTSPASLASGLSAFSAGENV